MVVADQVHDPPCHIIVAVLYITQEPTIQWFGGHWGGAVEWKRRLNMVWWELFVMIRMPFLERV